jgi:trans-aconitate methyltransferase
MRFNREISASIAIRLILGNAVVWEPDKYLRGNYFQKEINEAFRKSLRTKFYGNILDIGCGDGSYTHFLAEKVKHSHILGIDSSEEMIRHANQHWTCRDLSFEVHKIEDFVKPLAFDFIFSFWCLHWTNINLSFPGIFQSLKEGGKVYAVFSSFSNHSILQAWKELEKEERYSFLRKGEEDLSSQFFYQVVNVLSQLPFRQVRLTIKTIKIYFPALDYFKNLVMTMPFMKRIPADRAEEFIEDMTKAFHQICQRRYGDKLYYETRPIYLEAMK